MTSPLERDLMAVETLLAGLAASAELVRTERMALRGALGTVQGVRNLRLARHLHLVPNGRTATPPVDLRERQLPVGDRSEGGAPDAA